MTKLNMRRQGQVGEDLASEYLLDHGFQIIQRNYRFQRGEIDIIAQDGNELVFIEVKARHSDEYGLPEDAITPEKEKQIRCVAEGYYCEHNIDNQPCRFDVVAIETKNGHTEIRHIRDAF